MIRVIGFCDVPGKPRDMEWVVQFRDADCYDIDAPPTAEALREYATERGYYPSGKAGAHPGMCDPVYRYLPGHVHEHRVRPRGVGA